MLRKSIKTFSKTRSRNLRNALNVDIKSILLELIKKMQEIYVILFRILKLKKLRNLFRKNCQLLPKEDTTIFK